MQISNLPASNSFSSTDVLPIEINGVTYKVTGATLAAALQTLGNYLTPDNVANNLTTTAAGSVLDARQGKVLNDKINATQSDIAIIIEGNQTTHTGGVAVGEYVIVRNSTISGITDGLYKAVQAIPANTAIDSTYLTAVEGGGLNALNNYIEDLIQVKKYSKSYSLAANGTDTFIAQEFNITNVNGYHCVGCVGYDTDDSHVYPYLIEPNPLSTNIFQQLKNTASTSLTGTIALWYMFIKDFSFLI